MVTAEAMYAIPRMSYPTVSYAALTSLSQTITDTEYLTLEPSLVAFAVEIVQVEVDVSLWTKHRKIACQHG